MTRILAFLLLSLPIPAHAAGPEATARSFFQDLIGVASLAEPDTRTGRVATLVNEKFDFSAFYERAVADHWSSWSETQKGDFDGRFRKKFIDHLSNHLNFLDRIAGATVSYATRWKDGSHVVVTAKGRVEGKGIPVHLYLIHSQGVWRVYDLEISGANLSRNYRGMINYVVRNKGFEGLLAKLDT